MKHAIVIALAILVIPAAIAVAAIKPAPGGPAPKPLLGTWRTKLTSADEAHSSAPADWPAQLTFELVVVNAGDGVNPRALGLRPLNQGGDSVGFGVTGNRIFLKCLDAGAAPTAGYGTYAWTVKNRTLTFKLVKEPCRDKGLRQRITILTSHPWHKAG